MRSQSIKRYASRYTRDDTQEINSRRGTSTWDDASDYSSSNNNGDAGDAGDAAGTWGRDSYYDQRDRGYEAPRENGNSWSNNGYDDRRDYDRRDYDRDSYDDRRDTYISSYSSYDRPAPSYPGFTGVLLHALLLPLITTAQQKSCRSPAAHRRSSMAASPCLVRSLLSTR